MIREAESEPSREELIALIGALRAENASLKARIAELERRLGLNSSNSGKPPSMDAEADQLCGAGRYGNQSEGMVTIIRCAQLTESTRRSD